MFDPRVNLIHALFARTFTALDDNLRDPTDTSGPGLITQHRKSSATPSHNVDHSGKW